MIKGSPTEEDVGHSPPSAFYVCIALVNQLCSLCVPGRLLLVQTPGTCSAQIVGVKQAAYESYRFEMEHVINQCLAEQRAA